MKYNNQTAASSTLCLHAREFKKKKHAMLIDLLLDVINGFSPFVHFIGKVFDICGRRYCRALHNSSGRMAGLLNSYKVVRNSFAGFPARNCVANARKRCQRRSLICESELIHLIYPSHSYQSTLRFRQSGCEFLDTMRKINLAFEVSAMLPPSVTLMLSIHNDYRDHNSCDRTDSLDPGRSLSRFNTFFEYCGYKPKQEQCSNPGQCDSCGPLISRVFIHGAILA